MTVRRLRMRAKIAAVMAGVIIGVFFSVGVHGIALARSASEKKARTVTRKPRLQLLQLMLADKFDEEYDELTLSYCHQMLNPTPFWMTSLMESGWDGTLAGFNSILHDFGIGNKKEEHDARPWIDSLLDDAEEQKRYGLVLKLLELAEKEVRSHKPEDWDDLVGSGVPAKWFTTKFLGCGFWERIACAENRPSGNRIVGLIRKQRQEDKDRLKTRVFDSWKKQIEQLCEPKTHNGFLSRF